VLDIGSVWGVTVIRAQISTAKTWDWPFYTAPDPYVVVEVGGQKGNTSAKNDTYDPEWNELLFSATAGTLVSNQLKISVYDDDLANDQLMGQCEVVVPEAVLLGGAGVVPSCGPEILSIELKFNLQ
jgi:Ca2+-dependent lipid-binding protein